MSLPINVVNLNNEEANHRILRFLNEKKRKSENTYKNYVRYYKEFFRFTCNKEIHEITWEDIFSITYSKVDDFKQYLLDKGDSSNYVNQKLFACKALWKKLYMINHNVDMKVFDFEKEEIEENNFASLDSEEMELLINFAREEEHKKPLTKSLFFEFLYIMGCRKNVALELEWNQFSKKHDLKNNVEVWVVRYHDKGKWIEKSIHDDFYAKLLKLKETGESAGNKVFDINKDTLENVFKRFQKKYNLFEKNGKKVCIHSIKKASGWLVQNIFGDLNLTRKHLQHKNIQLTAAIYMGDENYAEQASYMIGKNIEVDFLNTLSKEEIIQLIETSGKEIMLKLYYKYSELPPLIEADDFCR